MKDVKVVRFLRKYKLRLIAGAVAIALIFSLLNINAILALFRKKAPSASKKPTEATQIVETIDPSLTPEKALEQLTISIKKTPNDPALYIQRGSVYYNQGSMDAALADFTTAIALKDTPRARYLRAVVYSATGNNRAAHVDLTAALGGDSDNQDYVSLMVDVCNALKEYAQALTYLDKLLAKEPDNCVLRTLAGDACVYLERFADAIPHYEKAIATYTEAIGKDGISKATLYSAYANCLKSVNRFADAVVAYDNSLQLSENKELYFQRGFCLLQSENYTDAIKDFDKCIELKYEPDYAHFQRALCYYATKEYEKAVADFTVYEKAFADKKDSFIYMGLCYQNLKKYDEAIPYYTKCIEADISKGECYFNLGNCYYNQEKYSDAVERYTEAIALGSYKYESLLNRGICYIKLNKYNEAKVDLKTVMDECEDSSLVESATKSYEPIKNITIVTKK